MGELAGWMDEGFVRTVFQSSMNENVQVKIIRDRHSGYDSRISLVLYNHLHSVLPLTPRRNLSILRLGVTYLDNHILRQ
jgi:hypothetical protein